MSDLSKNAQKPSSPAPAPTPAEESAESPARILLVPYPKIVFLYPSFLVALVAAVVMTGAEMGGTTAKVVSVVFLGVLAVNLVVLAFDFPRTTSLTLFFFAASVVMGFVLLFTFHPELLPRISAWLARFHPLANATFYWTFAGALGVIYLLVLIAARFDYWEVRPNELLHHHGFLSNLERFSAPNLQIEKEINDVFEFMLLRSGRLILHASDDRRAIVLDNIPRIDRKEEAITQMLSALQVQVRPDRTAR